MLSGIIKRLLNRMGMRMGMWLRIGSVMGVLLVLIAGCGGGGGGGGNGRLVHNAPTVLEGTYDFQLGEGGSVEGIYSLPGGVEMRVQAATDDDGISSASFTYEETDGVEVPVGPSQLSVTLTAEGVAELDLDGASLGGNGALNEEQAQALEVLVQSPMWNAVAGVPLQVGCHQNAEIDPGSLAALLFPLQAVIKYRIGDRHDFMKQLTEDSICAYLTDDPEDLRPAPEQIILSNAAHVPVVFGYFPFDEEGAYQEDSTSASSASSASSSLSAIISKVASRLPLPLELATAPEPAEIGPCDSMCRGACGPDCTLVNCTQDQEWFCEETSSGTLTGKEARWDIFNCGIHTGCIWHDQCYDDCNRGRCGSWGASWCRHNTVTGCDVTAAHNHGRINCIQWARGKGTFSSRTDFPYNHLLPIKREAPMCAAQRDGAIQINDEGVTSNPWSPPEGFSGDTLSWSSSLAILLTAPEGTGYRLDERGEPYPGLNVHLRNNDRVTIQYSIQLNVAPPQTIIWEKGDLIEDPRSYKKSEFKLEGLVITDESGDPTVIETNQGRVAGMSYSRDMTSQVDAENNWIKFTGEVVFNPKDGFDHNRIARGGGWFHVGLPYTRRDTVFKQMVDDEPVFETTVTSDSLAVGAFSITFWWDPDKVLDSDI